MKNVSELFIRLDTVSRLSQDGFLEANVRRVNGFFITTINDAVTGAVIKTFFLGELNTHEKNRFTIIEKRGTKLRCIARADNFSESLENLNKLLEKEGIYPFPLESLARLS